MARNSYDTFQDNTMRSDDNSSSPTGTERSIVKNGAQDNSEDEEANDTGCSNVRNSHSSACLKVIALILMCIMGFGNYFCYDNPGALQSPIQNEMNASLYEFNKLYSFYSWPNVALPIVGGYLMDRVFGIPLGAIIFALFICLGQGLFAVGAFADSFVLMKGARIIFGIGGESIAVAANTYASAWFQGQILSTVIAFQLSISRIGSSVNFATVGRLFTWLKEEEGYLGTSALGWTLIISGTSTIASLIAAVVLGGMEKRRAKLANQGMEEQPKISLKDITKFSFRFWLISGVCVIYYITIFPFISNAQKFLIETFGFDKEAAATLQGVPYLLSAFAVPVFGIMIDRFGRNIGFVALACAITLSSHTILAFAKIKILAYVGFGLMGIGYSLLAAALWPMIALITPLHQQGTAFGFTQAIQNLGLALCALLAGFIAQNYGYFWLEIFFVGSLVATLLLTFVLFVVDRKQDNYLQMTISERKAFELTPRYREIMGNEYGYVEI